MNNNTSVDGKSLLGLLDEGLCLTCLSSPTLPVVLGELEGGCHLECR